MYTMIREMILKNKEKWHRVFIVLMILEIFNYRLLSKLISWKYDVVISIFILIIAGVYVEVLYKEFKNNLQDYLLTTVKGIESKCSQSLDSSVEVLSRQVEEMSKQNQKYLEEKIMALHNNSVENHTVINEVLKNNYVSVSKCLGELDTRVKTDIVKLNTNTDKNREILIESISKFATQEMNNSKKNIQGFDNIITIFDNFKSESVANNLEGLKKINEIIESNNDKVQESINQNQKLIKLEFGNIHNQIINSETKYISEISNNFNKVNSKLTSVDDKIEKLNSLSKGMQSELENSMNHLLDEVEDNGEDVKNTYNSLFKQITGFSTETKQKLVSISNGIEKSETSLEAYYKTAYIQHGEYQDDIHSLEKYVETLETHTLGRHNEVKGKLDNLEIQILNLNNLATLINNLKSKESLINVDDQKFNNQPGEFVKASIATNKQLSKTIDSPTVGQPRIPKNKQSKKQVDRSNIDLEKATPKTYDEEIYDSETGTKLLNHYKDSKLVASDMYIGTVKKYTVVYDTVGRVVKSKNYDDDGKVTTELEYFSNGQIQSRIENIIVKGKVKREVTKFNMQGNKIKK